MSICAPISIIRTHLYDPLYMPNELLIAHRANDKAVMAAYGVTKNMEAFTNESACVAILMEMYQEMVETKNRLTAALLAKLIQCVLIETNPFF